MEDKLCQLRTFLSLTLTMGMIRKPAIEDYWSRANWSINSPAFGSVMSLKKDQLLLHNTCPPRDDPLFNISQLMFHLNDTFIHYYTQTGDGWLQRKAIFGAYMPNKHHHQWGPKLWVAAESNLATHSYLMVRCM